MVPFQEMGAVPTISSFMCKIKQKNKRKYADAKWQDKWQTGVVVTTDDNIFHNPLSQTKSPQQKQ